MRTEITETDIFLFGARNINFGTEVSQVISVIKSLKEMDQSHESIPIFDLTTKHRIEEACDASSTSCGLSSDSAGERASPVLLVDTEEGIIGVHVESVQGVISMPLWQIEPLPEFLKSRIETDSIWGIGKLEQELIVLLDLGEYLSDTSVWSGTYMIGGEYEVAKD